MKEQLPRILAKTERTAHNSHLITIEEAQSQGSMVLDFLQK